MTTNDRLSNKKGLRSSAELGDTGRVECLGDTGRVEYLTTRLILSNFNSYHGNCSVVMQCGVGKDSFCDAQSSENVPQNTIPGRY